MLYATLDDLARAATDGWDELAQRAARSPLVDGMLLQATAEGGDRSTWSADALALADTALVRLEDVLERASRHADGYIAPRYTGVLPLPAALVASSNLPAVVAAIALRLLYGAIVPEEIAKGTRWADEFLRDLSTGRVSLGVADTATSQPPGRVVSRAPEKSIDWDRY